jgi:outer membrane protein TolC
MMTFKTLERRTGVIIVFTIFTSGCATYHPKPITSETVEAKLRVPGYHELSMKAAAINHPLIPPVKLNPDQGLSPDEASVLAVLLNPSLQAIRDQRALAQAQLIEAGLLPNPELSASIDIPIGGPSGKVNAFGLDLNWDITALIYRSAKVDMENDHVKSVNLEVAWQEWQIAQAARDAVNHWLCIEDQMEISRKFSLYMKNYLDCVMSAVSAGSLGGEELASARENSRRAEEDVINLEKQASRQMFLVKQLIGLPFDSSVRLNKAKKLPSFARVPCDGNSMITGIENRRPDLLALKFGYESQEAAVRTAVLEQFPAIRIGSSISRDTDNMNTTGAVLSMELPIFNRKQGKIAYAQATRQKLFDEYASRVFEARSDVARITEAIHDTNKQIEYTMGVEDEMEQRIEKANSALNDGRMDAQKYTPLLQGVFETKMKIAALKGQLAEEVISLQSTSGYFEIPESSCKSPVN